ncbi:MAG TPA: hypothetical protein VNQ76_17600 [Planctomicrobium sp.]|nr:hypothetical protein [Planctomicrobium sp.]
MSDPIVIELQRLASDGKCPVDELLRKALIVSTKLQISDFSEWIRSELNGYQDKEVPEYRVVSTSLKAINPVNGIHMPIFTDVPSQEDEFSRAPLGVPVGELSVLLQSDSEFFKIRLPNSVQRRLHRQCDMPMPLECYLRVSPNSVFRIMDAVRNTILNWALKLEQEGILGEGMRFSPEEKAIAMTNQNIHIGNFQGILGNVSGSTVSQSLNMSIKAGDFNSLKQRLTEAGITPEDLQSLKTALEADRKPTSSSQFGPQVSAWIGTMMGKAASGVWKVTLDTAGKLIPTAIAAYYGLS